MAFLSLQKSAKQHLKEVHSRQHTGLKHQLRKEKLVNQNRRLAESTIACLCAEILVSSTVTFSSSISLH